MKCSETYDDWAGCSSKRISSHSSQSDHEDMIDEHFILDVMVLIRIWNAQEEGGEEEEGVKKEEELSTTSRIKRSSQEFRSLLKQV